MLAVAHGSAQTMAVVAIRMDEGTSAVGRGGAPSTLMVRVPLPCGEEEDYPAGWK